MPKLIAKATLEGTRKGGRGRKRWGDEAEENLNIKGITTGR
jgi:hypothetical protein